MAGFLEESTILHAHRHLGESRFLSQRDLEAFTPFVTVQHAGAIPRSDLEAEDARALARVAPVTDPRLERVRAQQFLRFGVVRRDVRYEMCGTTGTVALSGAKLVGARGPRALGPIHRRLMLLAVAVVGLVIVASAWHSAFAGPTIYFAGTNSLIGWVLTFSVGAALLAANGGLRRLRPGFRWWPSSPLERAFAMAFLVMFISAPLIALARRPTVAEARAAITAGDLEKAGIVVEALKAARPSDEVTSVSDELTIATAERLSGDERIAKLDEAATHPGPRAEDARKRAQQARIEAVRAILAAKRPADALARLDAWASELATATDAPELRAQADELTATQCPDAACRFLATRSAEAAHTSPARAQAVARAREDLLAALQPREAAEADPLVRIRALRVAAAMGSTVKAASPDDELSQRASGALSAVSAELAKIRLVGAPAALVDEVLGRPQAGSPLTGWPELEGVAVYSAESGGRCAGLYVVGATKEGRALSGKDRGLTRLLAQATGSASAAVQARPKSGKEHDVSRWSDGGTPVMARWSGETLMELRIGAAPP